MRRIITVLFAGLIQFSVFSQEGCQTIRVTEDIELIKLSDNAYIHVSYITMAGYGRTAANGLIFIDGREAFLFDTPWNDSLTCDLYKWITDSMNLKLAGFVPNHWHEDCMGGLSFLQKKNIKTYGNLLTTDIAKLHGLPVPLEGFKDSLELTLGDKLIRCYFLGAAHSMDNIIVWIPSEKILFPGCMVKSLNSTNLGNTKDGDLNAYPNTIRKLLDKFPDAEIVIPGHGLYGGPELIKHTLTLTEKDLQVSPAIYPKAINPIVE